MKRILSLMGLLCSISNLNKLKLIAMIAIMTVVTSLLALKPLYAQSELTTSPAAEKIKPLQIGDTIPEELWNLPLQVVNHPEGKETITLNDYRDKKLIILDFWATWCAPCIKSLRQLDSIYPDFYDDVFILPSTIESANLSETKFKKEEFDLFTAVQQITLRKYFPCQYIPHQIWLADNKVYAITDGEASTSANITQFLAGGTPVLKYKRDIFFDPFSTIDTYAKERNAPVIFNSLITGYIDGLGNSGRQLNDSVQTYYYLNRPLIDIYRSAIKLTYNRIEIHDDDVDWLINESVDPINLYCYQLYADRRVDDEAIKTKTVADLNTAFNISGRFKKRLKPCYVISGDGGSHQVVPADGYPISSLIDMLNHSVQWSPNLPLFVGENYGNSCLPERPDVYTIAKWRESPSTLKEVLKPLGLKIHKAERNTDIFVIESINKSLNQVQYYEDIL